MPDRNTVIKEGTTQNAKENEEHMGKPDILLVLHKIIMLESGKKIEIN